MKNNLVSMALLAFSSAAAAVAQRIDYYALARSYEAHNANLTARGDDMFILDRARDTAACLKNNSYLAEVFNLDPSVYQLKDAAAFLPLAQIGNSTDIINGAIGDLARTVRKFNYKPRGRKQVADQVIGRMTFLFNTIGQVTPAEDRVLNTQLLKEVYALQQLITASGSWNSKEVTTAKQSIAAQLPKLLRQNAPKLDYAVMQIGLLKLMLDEIRGNPPVDPSPQGYRILRMLGARVAEIRRWFAANNYQDAQFAVLAEHAAQYVKDGAVLSQSQRVKTLLPKFAKAIAQLEVVQGMPLLQDATCSYKPRG